MHTATATAMLSASASTASAFSNSAAAVSSASQRAGDLDPFDAATLDALDRLAGTRRDETVLSWQNDLGERHEFTAAELDRWVEKTAGYLASRGVGVGDVVATSLDGHYQAWFVALAALRLGATALRLPADASEERVYRLLSESQACAVVCSNRGSAPDVLEHVVYLCPSVKVRAMVNGDGAPAVFSAPDEWDETCLPPSCAEDGLPHGDALSGPDGVCALGCQRCGWLDFNTCVRVAAPRSQNAVELHACVAA
jgi:acetyl-CoA synthetase